MRLYKRYIPVIALVMENGDMVPMFIVWQDEREDKKVYKVDKVMNKRRSFSRVGGCGILYECMICGRKRKLYLEKDKWFIECIYQAPLRDNT